MCRKARKIYILPCLERTWEWGCHLEYSICGKELGSILLRRRIKEYLDLASTRFRIRSVLKDFRSGEQIQKKLPIRKQDSTDTWGRKPHPKRLKLRIQKSPDTCGRVENLWPVKEITTKDQTRTSDTDLSYSNLSPLPLHYRMLGDLWRHCGAQGKKF